MRKVISLTIVMAACILPGLSAQAQEQRAKVILFHVTSVQRADNSAACKSATCSSVKYTVSGYADVENAATKTEYVITCDEFMNDRPHPHRDNICARFHAGKAYMAQLQSDVISFPHSMLNKDFETDYSIMSERAIPLGPDDRMAPGGSEPREATNGPDQRNAPKGPEQLASKGAN